MGSVLKGTVNVTGVTGELVVINTCQLPTGSVRFVVLNNV
jgi:hypothetical protein